MKNVTVLVVIWLSLIGAASAANWWENIEVKGDLRYRHEMIKEGDDDARNRHRLRARVGIKGKVNDFTDVGIQFATGSDDPVSTNQTLDNGFSTKSLMLDMAYLIMKPEFAEGLSVTGGKFKNPFFKPGDSELIWDSDWNPEGGVINYSHNLEDLSVTLIGAGLWIEERSSDKDSWLGAAQAAVGFDLNEEQTGLKVGSSFFNYINTAGYAPFFDNEEYMGNSVDTLGNYINDYRLIEVFVEIEHNFDKIPVTVMGDFITNTGADSLNTGWLAGIRAGKAKKPGSWDFRYIYRQVEKDAAIGTFIDSDFRGGGADAKGHEIGGGYQVSHNMKFNVTYFINKIGLEEEEMTDFSRLQVDLQLKF